MTRIIDANVHGTRGDLQAVAQLVVDGESAGQRLDNFLFRHVKGVPKTHIYRLIRRGEVRIDRRRAAADTRLNAGEVVRVPPLRRAPAARAAFVPAHEFPVLFEDEALIAIDKPAGVAVHGGSGVSFGVVEQLRQARPAARTLELVHRLDRGTSGVLLLAKKRSALRALQAGFRQRQIDKTYLALVVGDWPERTRVIDRPLLRYVLAGGERRVKAVDAAEPGAMRALTLVQVRARWPGYTLLEVALKTGRTHQIRVHLSTLGHPIAGDDKYGSFADNRRLQKAGLKRMALHAWRLAFEHPVSAERIVIEAPLPPDLPLPPDFLPAGS